MKDIRFDIISITGKTTPEEFLRLYNILGDKYPRVEYKDDMSYYLKKKRGLFTPTKRKLEKSIKDMSKEEYSAYRKEYYKNNRDRLKTLQRGYWLKKKNR